MQGYVYILKSPNNIRCYIGSTTDPERRLSEHNSGLVAATNGKGPWEYAFCQEFDAIEKARRAESWLKKMKSRKIVETVIQDGKLKRDFGLG